MQIRVILIVGHWLSISCSNPIQFDQQRQMPILAILVPPAPLSNASSLPSIGGKRKLQFVDNSVEHSSSSTSFAFPKSEEADRYEQNWLVSGEIGKSAAYNNKGSEKRKTTKSVGNPMMSSTTTKNPNHANEALAAPFGQCLAACLAANPFASTTSAPRTMATSKKQSNQKSTTAEPFYYEYEAPPDITQFGPCNVSVIRDQAQLIVVNLLFYVIAAWVPFWAFLAIAVNLSFRQFGHHRWLDFYQELGFILLFPFMGVFVLKPKLDLLCPVTTMVLLFFMVFILVIGFLQAYFASSLIKGTSLKDGRLPVAVNYVWPLALAALPVAISVWLLRNQIGTNGVQLLPIACCFAPIHSDLFWVFVVPAWLLWLLLLVRNQLSVTACKQSRPTVDREQLYWARKSVKGTPILLCFFLLAFFTQLFAVDLQLFWLCVLFAAECLLLGPLLFLLHTHNHQKVNNGIFERTQMGLYRPCVVRRMPVASSGPPPPTDLLTSQSQPIGAVTAEATQTVVPPPTVSVQSAPPVMPNAKPSIVVSAQPSSSSAAAAAQSLPPIVQPMPGGSSVKREVDNMANKTKQQLQQAEGTGDANAQMFYEWLTDSDERNLKESERVLWPPRPL